MRLGVRNYWTRPDETSGQNDACRVSCRVNVSIPRKDTAAFFCLRTAVANGRGCKEVKLEQSTVIVPTLLI